MDGLLTTSGSTTSPNVDPPKSADLFRVDGKTVLITGGSSGIGRMLAMAFVANGAEVGIVGRDATKLDAAVSDISAHGRCWSIAADLSGLPGVDAVAQAVALRGRPLNILINNAGASWGEAVETFPEKGFDRILNLNLKAPFFLAQRLLPSLAAAATNDDWARVINLSSVAAQVVNPNNAVYGASKAGLEHLTRILARAFANHRITVNGIAPGWFPSRMNAGIAETHGGDWIAATPHHRFGTIEDVAGLAIFLSSRAGIFVNGQTITLDGGKTL
jgi:NAD(P)-dependent dehydrogenase (short-subunit alcohol dehydrogenase family)